MPSPQPPSSPNLRDYLQILRRRRWSILAVMAVAIVGAAALSFLRSPVYESTATIEFRGEADGLALVGTATSTSVTPEKDAAADAALVTSGQVERIAERGLPGGTPADAVETEVDPDSNLIGIVARASGPREASRIANAYAEATETYARGDLRGQYLSDARELRSQADRLRRSGADAATLAPYEAQISRLISLSSVARPVEIIDAASPADAPSSPRPARDIAIAALLGLIGGVALAIGRSAADQRFGTSREVEPNLGIPVLGHVRNEALGTTIATNNSGALDENELEAFRIIRSNLQFLDIDSRLRSVVVTSSVPEEGKSTVAAATAYAGAVAGVRTVLVECDFRRPVLAERLGLADRPGLADHLAGRAELAEASHRISVAAARSTGAARRNGSGANGNGSGKRRSSDERAGELDAVEPLTCLCAGDPTPRPAELLASDRFRRFLTELYERYELIVLDAPPLLPVGDTLGLLPLCDAAIFCLRLEATTREEASAGVAALEHAGGRSTGAVVTGLRAGAAGDYYGSYAPAEPRRRMAAERR